MKKLALGGFRIKNFKAVRDSKTIKFTPLTVFIGNNGSGNGSIIEGYRKLEDVKGRLLSILRLYIFRNTQLLVV
jgi:predicted ATPase